MILVIDNYDSFVHNVARYFAILGAETKVVRNDAITVSEVARLDLQAIVISPGPCSPNEAGISNALLRDLSGIVPILGVCLGHQCIGDVFGGRTTRAKQPLYGQASDIRHTGHGLFAGLPQPLQVGRYHSLIVEATEEMASTLDIDAWSQDGEIMALSHKTHATYGVQFHPESILTPSGLALFGNFLTIAKTRVADAVA